MGNNYVLRSSWRRPIFYWPCIGVIAVVLTKEGLSEPSVWYFWLGISCTVGFLLEWWRSKNLKFLFIGIFVAVGGGVLFKASVRGSTTVPDEMPAQLRPKFSKQTASIEIAPGKMVDDVRVSNEEPPRRLNQYLNFFLEQSNLIEIEKSFPQGKIVSSGDAGASLHEICLSSPAGFTVKFQSGEMGGAKMDLLEVKLMKTKASEKCPLNPNLSNTFGNGLKLGMRKEQVVQLLGQAEKDGKDLLVYDWEVDRIINEHNFKNPRFTEMTLAIIKFEANKASEISVTQVTSN